MFDTLSDFENQIKRRSVPYCFKDRIRFLMMGWPIELHGVELEDGRKFKHITSKRNSTDLPGLAKVLALYHGSGQIPETVFVDEQNLIVEWVEGETFSSFTPDAEDYAQLGDFSAKGFREIEEEEIQPEIDHLNANLDYLKSQAGPTNREIADAAHNLLTEIGQCELTRTLSAICFGDTVSKNFVKTKDDQLSYIDVQGIYRKSIGNVSIKQISMTPRVGRRHLFESYNESLAKVANGHSYDLKEDLPFQFVSFIASKISKSYKTRRPGVKKRSARAHAILEEFSKLPADRETIVTWILERSPAYR